MNDVVTLAGGEFAMGSDAHYPEEAPVHRVRVGPFAIDRCEVTNARFAEFVEATGYVTVAERPLDAADFPGAPPENLVPGSLVFTPTSGPVDLRHLSQWWAWTPGACWRAPEGPGSSVEGRWAHPVVHVAYEDAAAYASWAGARLPTEAEWELAARGGLERAVFTWGDVARPGGRIMANTWDGPDFPWRSSGGSGFLRTAPVGSFPPNGFGLYDMAGNVWEWTDDWWAGHPADAGRPCCVPLDPRGGDRASSLDPGQPQFQIPRKVIKGGSHLCADSYCLRYRPAARRPQMIDTGMSHVGFRCAWPARLTTRPVGGDMSDRLPSWRPGPVRDAILEFLDGTGDVPVEDRVAYLDNDGTTWCEKPTYVQLDFFVDALRQRTADAPSLADRPEFAAVLSGDMAAVGEIGLAKVAGALTALFDGQTPDQFASAADAFLERYRHRTLGVPVGGVVYQPMLELIAELRRLDFTVGIVTGGGTEFVRQVSKRLYGIEPGMVVGTLIGYRFDRDDAGRPVVRRTVDQIGTANEGGAKVEHIHSQIGRAPILAVGNSGGDRELLEWAQAHRRGGLAVLVDHDDAEREFAYESQAATFKDAEPITAVAARLGWLVVSMRRDWETIFAAA